MNITIDDRKLKVEDKLDKSAVPATHLEAYKRKKFLRESQWLPLDTPEVGVSEGFIMCLGTLVFQDNKFLFEHTINEREPLQNLFRNIRPQLIDGRVEKIIVFKQASNYLKEPYLETQGRMNEMYRQLISEGFVRDIDVYYETIAEAAEKYNVEVLMQDVRLSQDSGDKFSVTVGDQKVVIWDELTNEAIEMFNFKDLMER